MAGIERLIVLAVFVPIVGSILTPVWGRISRTLRNAWVLILLLCSLWGSVQLLPIALRNMVEPLWPVALWEGVTTAPLFVVDAMGVLFLVVFSLVGTLVSIYSFVYMRDDRYQSEYYTLLPVVVGATLGVTTSANLLLMFVFWEIAGIGTWRLLGFYRRDSAVKAAERAFLITFFAASMMLIGLGIFYMDWGTLNWMNMAGRTANVGALLFILIGILAKSATLPLHVWVPDAYPEAPAPANALLSAVVEKIGIIAFARIFCQTFRMPEPWSLFIPMLAVVSAVVAGGAALVSKDVRRILAYSTVSQLGFMLIGFALCTEFGVAGAILYVIAHSLAKAGLFLSMGLVERGSGQRDIEKLGGLIKPMPVVGVSVFLLSLSLMGIPPLVGFFSKLFIVLSAAKTSLLVASIAIFVAILTMLYLLRLFNSVFLGDLTPQGTVRTSRIMTTVVGFLALVSVALGVLAASPVNVIAQATARILGG
jgi:formate hydrogenlyase subunit 3/multisubunit Na+/H+ antiporter MnhD subunit